MTDTDRIEMLIRGTAAFREKYLRYAFMIAKNAAGLAGINDQIPDYEDLVRSRLYFEEMKQALAEARQGAIVEATPSEP